MIRARVKGACSEGECTDTCLKACTALSAILCLCVVSGSGVPNWLDATFGMQVLVGDRRAESDRILTQLVLHIVAGCTEGIEPVKTAW